MRWKLSTREIEGVTILDVIDAKTGDLRNNLAELVKEVLDAGQYNILLNLEKVNYIDSSGIGDLLMSYSATQSESGKFKLLHAHPRVCDILEKPCLGPPHWEIFQDEEETIRSFNE
jgi:anti-anti-sigma factor